MRNIREVVDCYNAGRMQEAEKLAREYLADRPDDPQALHLLGNLCFADHRIDEAQELYESAIRHNTQRPDVHNGLGTIYRDKGMLDQAIDQFDSAIGIWLMYELAHKNLGSSLARRGKPDDRFLVSVITPTLGSADARRALESVQAQTYPNIEHLVVADGPDAEEAVLRMIRQSPRHPVHPLVLPYNTGADGFNGHRIYGAALHLVNGRFVCFLDEDNWFDPDHVSSMMERITTGGMQWAYALRKIVDGDGRFLARDDCNSLGRWPSWHNPGSHLVDVNCYMIRRDIALRSGWLWHYRLGLGTGFYTGLDYRLCNHLIKNYPEFDGTGLYTVNYKVGNSSKSATAKFFREGNKVMKQRYADGFPWAKDASESRSGQ